MISFLNLALQLIALAFVLIHLGHTSPSAYIDYCHCLTQPLHRNSKRSSMTPQSLSQCRASASSSAEPASATLKDHVDIAHTKEPTSSSLHVDSKSSYSKTNLTQRPTYPSTNCTPRPSTELLCSTTTTVTNTKTPVLCVAGLRNTHLRCGTERSIDDISEHRVEYMTSDTVSSDEHCWTHSALATAITGVEDDNVFAMEEGTRAIAGVVPGSLHHLIGSTGSTTK
jgi:hypothetical protein